MSATSPEAANFEFDVEGQILLTALCSAAAY